MGSTASASIMSVQEPEVIDTSRSPPTLRRQRIIGLRMDEVEKELRQQKAATHTARVSQKLKARDVLRTLRFLVSCAAGALYMLAEPALAAAEAISMLLIYILAIPNAVPTHSHSWHYTFAGSAEDVVALSMLRCIAVTMAYMLGTGPRLQRPYLWTAAIFAALSMPLGLFKLVAIRRSEWARRQWPPFITLYCVHIGFAVLQVLAAQRIAEWTRKRWENGFVALTWPSWQDRPDTWLLVEQVQWDAERGQALHMELGAEDDVPAEELADSDSRWISCGGLRVHYKLAMPLGQRHIGGSTGVVLIHSFGSGTFSWRQIQQPLADACSLPVLSFDRPGFGLSERPVIQCGAPLDGNPYSLKYQAVLTLQLASALGLHRIIFAGHADGALLALMAAAMACRELGSPLLRLSHADEQPEAQAQMPIGGRASGNAAPFPTSAAHAVPMFSGSGAIAQHRGWAGSLSDSLDWAWMSSQQGQSILQKMLRGEWPASIEARTIFATNPPAASDTSRLPGATWHSPLRIHSLQRKRQGAEVGGWRKLASLQPRMQEEVGGGQSQAEGIADAGREGTNQLAEESTLSTAEQPLAQGTSALVTNPSLPSQDEAVQYSTLRSHQHEKAGQTEQDEQELHVQHGRGEGAGRQQQAERAELEGSLLQLDTMHHSNTSFMAAGSSGTGALPPLQPSATGKPVVAFAASAAAECDANCNAPAAAVEEGASEESMWRMPEPVGLILLHPDLSGDVAPKYARVLASSRLGRRVLRSLLRTEMGEVANWRAWADPQRLTPELLELYRRPLHVRGWDMALIEVARACNHIHSLERAQLLGTVAEAGLPVLVATGEHDRFVPPSALSRIAKRLGAAAPRLAVLPQCGHMSHEEAPHVLLDFLLAFICGNGLLS